jgi:VWFA-related protein
MWRLSVIGLTVLAVAPGLARQQPPPSPLVFRTSADVATIDAVVTDSDGKPVTNLTRDDFEVSIAGKRQSLEQAVYVRTQEQPGVLAAARAAAASNRPPPPAGLPIVSPTSQALRAGARAPDDFARTIAIVVDDLGLSFRSIFDVRRAVHKYIDTQVASGDLVAIIRTGGGVGALQQFTTDKRLLHLAADRLQWNMENRGGLGPAGLLEQTAPESAEPGSVERLHDNLASVGSLAALEFIARGVSELPGRKCIVFFSEGFDLMFDDHLAGSARIWSAMSRMLAGANAAGVVINTIDGRGLSTGRLAGPASPNQGDWRTRDGFSNPNVEVPAGTSAAGSGSGFLDAPGHKMGAADTTNGRAFVGLLDSLKFIADQTGGLAIENTNDLNAGLSRILADQQGYYLLGYTASPRTQRSGWEQNRVQVRVKRRGLRVRARQGFFGPAEPSDIHTMPASTNPLLMAAVSPFASGAMTVRLTSVFGYDGRSGSYVRSLLFIDPTDIHFEVDAAGRHTARVQILLLAIGDNGQVADWNREVPLALTEQAYRRVTECGLVVTVRSDVKGPGPYQMRAAVEDMASKSIGSASQFLEIPEVGPGRLALSGLLLRGISENDQSPASPASGDTTGGLDKAVLVEPEVRVLAPGSSAVYAYEVYDGLKDADRQLQASMAVSRDGKVIHQSPFTPVNTGAKSGDQVRVIPIGGQLTLGSDMAAGAYTLEVIVRGQDKKKFERTQWLDFEIRH